MANACDDVDSRLLSLPRFVIRRRYWPLFVTLLALFASGARAARTVVPLDDGWRFKEAEAAGAGAAAFHDAGWDAVTVPHAFPPIGPPDHLAVYRGEAWYRRKLDTPADWKGHRVFLRFDAVAMVSETYLNGQSLGVHRGGFAAFTYEVTGRINYGGPNQLAVRVDNQWNNDVAPLEQSLLYGGIYRGVSLIVTEPLDITLLDYASPGVFLTPRQVNADAATVEVKTEIDNATDAARTVAVRITLTDAAGKIVQTVTGSVAAASSATTADVQSLTVLHPHLWNGVADPYLYSVRVDLLVGGDVLDTVTQPLGLRFFRVDPKLGYFLNGVQRQIHGVCLHQDWGSLGWAVGAAQEEQDLKLLRDMGADGLRLVHYQHSQSALDLYDRTGMLVWCELAQFRLVGTSDAYEQNVRQQLTEMIRQNYNHPSIVMWSLYNELASSVRVPAERIVKGLNAIAHDQDPMRPTVAAGSGDTIYNARTLSAMQDLIGDNNYAGWYSGAPEDMTQEIEKINALYGRRGLAISEYGGGAKISDHKQGLQTGDVAPRGGFQPEEWQALVHEGNYHAIRSHPAVWGSFVWLAFDSGGLPRNDGTIAGGNIKGLVTQDRRTCKDAYYFYQANWSTKPMLYLASRRDVNRTEATTAVKAYSNAPVVTLAVNGKSYGRQMPDDLHAFHWTGVVLLPGRNVIELTGENGLKDAAVWTLGAGAANGSSE